MKPFLHKTLLLGAGMALASLPAHAAVFANDSVILGFHIRSGQGSGSNVYFNLGTTTGVRDGVNNGYLGNIGQVLSETYGADWYSNANLHFGVIGNFNPNTPVPGQLGYRAPVDGDPSRTVYIGRPVDAPGTAGPGFPSAYFSDLGIIGGRINDLETLLIPNNDPLTNITILPASAPNGWSLQHPNFDNPDGTGAFGAIPFGEIEQGFNKGTSFTYVDIQRFDATQSPILGENVNYLAIGSDGSVYLGAIPEPATALLGLLAGAVFAARRSRNS